MRTVLIAPPDVKKRAKDQSSSLAKFMATRGSTLLPRGIATVDALVDIVEADEKAAPGTVDEQEVARRRRRLRDLLWLATYLEVDDAFRKAQKVLVGLAVVVAAATATFAWAANPPAETPAATAAVPARPVEVQLLLTSTGRQDFAATLGGPCADAATKLPGLRGVAIAADASSTTVVLIPDGACTIPHRLTVATDQGTATSRAAVTPPTPSTTPSLRPSPTPSAT